MTFEIRYDAPDGSCSSYAATEMLQDERQMLIDIEENIANLERSLTNREGKRSPAENSDVKSWSKIKNLVRQQQQRHQHRRKSSKRGPKSSDPTTPDRK